MCYDHWNNRGLGVIVRGVVVVVVRRRGNISGTSGMGNNNGMEGGGRVAAVVKRRRNPMHAVRVQNIRSEGLLEDLSIHDVKGKCS